MQIDDSRRLTGLNLQSPGPGAVTDVSFTDTDDIESFLAAWSAALDRFFAKLDWPDMARWVRQFPGGASLVIDAPLDALYAATEINEWAIQSALGSAPPLEKAVHTIQQSLATESNKAMTALQDAAEEYQVPFVWDDDFVSLGLGRTSQTWPTDALPSTDEVDWSSFKRIPFAYVTGTNGKTTTTRMAMSILRAAKISHAGTSSDGVVVNGEDVEKGDWTGPGAARLALRHTEVDMAILETARGGLLRRGLVLEGCDAAVITNIANDHLGDYGVLSLTDMAEAKGICCRAVRPNGRRVLNANDPHLRALGETPGAPIVWFSMEPNAHIEQHLRAGGTAWTQKDGAMVCHEGPKSTHVLPISSIPACHGGRAKHNIENALAAAALTHALGISVDHIAAGLSGFGANASDNPGRCDLLELHGVRFLLDFGHNPHGLRAILQMARGLFDDGPVGRICITLGQAGDRSNDDLQGLVDAVHETGPERIMLREVPGYERGRPPREVPDFLTQSLIDHGHPPASLSIHSNEVDAMKAALQWAQPGDFIVHLVHMDRKPIRAILDEWSGPSAD